MREIALDTETTGLDPRSGHRIVEIGCVEMINHMATGEIFHVYINPEREMPEEAAAIHGLTDEFLQDKPKMAAVVDGFLEFVGDDLMVIHNAAFDMKFINAELERLGRATLSMDQSLDTVRMARHKFPGAQASLDALCRRFGIDNSERTFHGALLDAELLAEVYLELVGGRQPGLELAADAQGGRTNGAKVDRVFREPRPHAATVDELTAHAEFMKKLKDPLWEA